MIDPEIDNIDDDVRVEAQIRYDLMTQLYNVAALSGLSFDRLRDGNLYRSEIKSKVNISYVLTWDGNCIKVVIDTFLNAAPGSTPPISSDEMKFDLMDPDCFRKIVAFLSS